MERDPRAIDAKIVQKNGGFLAIRVWYSTSPTPRAKEIEGATGKKEYIVDYTDGATPRWINVNELEDDWNKEHSVTK